MLRSARVWRCWPSFMTMRSATPSPIASSTSRRSRRRLEGKREMESTNSELLLGNARIILADRVLERGWVAIADGKIAGVGEGAAPGRSEDAAGDLIMPGLVELHTDALEAHFVPRPKVFWDPIAAVISYDAQLATSGITTVLDSLRVWTEEGASGVDGAAGLLADAIGNARDGGLLRADHFLHLRCEVPMPSVVEEAKAIAGRPDVRLISLMDHTPGQRQFRDEGKLRDYYRGKGGGKTDAELDVLFARSAAYQQEYAAKSLREIDALAQRHNVPLASHADTTAENVADAIKDGIAVAEFPTTMEAARGLHRAGVSLLRGAMQLPRRVPGIELAAAIRTVTKTPAEAGGLADRGEIAISRRADMIRVQVAGEIPVVRSVWREGRRVA